jgi:hypothetical protein
MGFYDDDRFATVTVELPQMPTLPRKPLGAEQGLPLQLHAGTPFGEPKQLCPLRLYATDVSAPHLRRTCNSTEGH